MDKRAIKNFAIDARNTLMLGVVSRLSKLGITETGIEEPKRLDHGLIEVVSSKERYSGKDIINREKLVNELKKREQETDFKIAYHTLVEEVSYTWFNRLIAIRFMEINGYLPERLRVLSSETQGKKEPDIITALLETDLYQELDETLKAKVTELLMDGSASAVDELYQLVFIRVCNRLNKQLPDLFEKIDDYTELLFTISYIDENGVIVSLLNISEEDFDVNQGGQVEIIGWMYQYYNTEPKDKVFARGNRKIRADEIPAATQLFTPEWIVRYMVENSLGRYYIDQKLANPLETRTEKEIADSFGWKYYLPTAEQPEDVQLQIADERKEKSVFSLQELKLLDNAMGSGHVLVYAFDVFIELYEAEGFGRREAAELILENNLFGLEIDKRAYQLAYFAMLMKGRQYSRRILQKNIHLNLHQFENSSNIPEEYYERIQELSTLSAVDFSKKLNNFQDKIAKFEHATEIGSVTDVSDIQPDDIEELRQFINVFDEFVNMDILYSIPETHERLNNILDIMEIMVNKYAAVVTNPPYLNKMSNLLGNYVTKNYKDVKTDMFSVFIKMNSNLLVKGGYAGFMTPFVWMFIKSYEQLRNYLIKNKCISSLIQMEYSAFEEATVPVCCFTIKNSLTEPIGNYFKLSDFRGGMKAQEEKVLEGIQDPSVDYFYQTVQNNYSKVPGMPISFWVSENIFNTFQLDTPINNSVIAKAGIVTGNDFFYTKFWHEVEVNKIKFDKNKKDDIEVGKYFPFAKGGEYRKWYGNNELIINLKKIWFGSPNNKSIRRGDMDSYFKKSISWGYITSGKPSFRLYVDSVFATASPQIISNFENTNYILGFLNSKVSEYFCSLINPTLNLPTGYVTILPLIKGSILETSTLSLRNIDISQRDWNSFENSNNFRKHPLI